MKKRAVILKKPRMFVSGKKIKYRGRMRAGKLDPRKIKKLARKAGVRINPAKKRYALGKGKSTTVKRPRIHRVKKAFDAFTACAQLSAALNQWKKISGKKPPQSTKEFYDAFSPYYYGGFKNHVCVQGERGLTWITIMQSKDTPEYRQMAKRYCLTLKRLSPKKNFRVVTY